MASFESRKCEFSPQQRWIEPWTKRLGVFLSNKTWLVVSNIFYFPYIGKNPPNWLIFLRGGKTTNQKHIWFECLKPPRENRLKTWRALPTARPRWLSSRVETPWKSIAWELRILALDRWICWGFLLRWDDDGWCRAVMMSYAYDRKSCITHNMYSEYCMSCILCLWFIVFMYLWFYK